MNDETRIDSQQRDSEEELAETVVLPKSKSTDNVGDASVEINVEELIAKIEVESNTDNCRKNDVRRKLEEFAEEQSLEDTYTFDLNEDL